MRVLIFTECGSQIGYGHLSRCSSLYEELQNRGLDVELIVYSSDSTVQMIDNMNHTIVNWMNTDFLQKYLQKNDHCIIDSYLADESVYQFIAKQVKQCVYLDDNNRIHYPKGIVVNPSLSTKQMQYPKNDTIQYLLGAKFVILRSPFIQVKREHVRPEVSDVLITIGGSDIRNLTPILLERFASRMLETTFHVIIGPGFHNREEIKKAAKVNVRCYENVTDSEMKNLMLKSDLAITSAGQTIYELLATQTPFIPIKIAENQSNNIAGLLEYLLVDSFFNFDDDFSKMEQELNRLIDVNKRMNIVNRFSGLVDGLGRKRIVDQLIYE